jgi:hypothetical protein
MIECRAHAEPIALSVQVDRRIADPPLALR